MAWRFFAKPWAFQKLQLLEHAVRQPFQKLPGIGTLPPLPYFVTVISMKIARTRVHSEADPLSFKRLTAANVV
jgi:hypothetical protein